MIGLDSLRWLLTAVFAGASTFHLIRCLRPALHTSPAAVSCPSAASASAFTRGRADSAVSPSAVVSPVMAGPVSASRLPLVLPPGRAVSAAGHRFSEVLHLVMGLSMIAMIWPWGEVVPAAVWIAGFTVSSGWFIARAVWSAGRRLVPAFFATAMGAMVWMGASMPAQASVTHTMPVTHAMPIAHGDTPAMGPSPATWFSAVLGCYLVLAAIWWTIHGLRIGRLNAALAVVPPALSVVVPSVSSEVVPAGLSVVVPPVSSEAVPPALLAEPRMAAVAEPLAVAGEAASLGRVAVPELGAPGAGAAPENAADLGRAVSELVAAPGPVRWAALCHGLMSAGMGLALLAMV